MPSARFGTLLTWLVPKMRFPAVSRHPLLTATENPGPDSVTEGLRLAADGHVDVRFWTLDPRRPARVEG